MLTFLVGVNLQPIDELQGARFLNSLDLQQVQLAREAVYIAVGSVFPPSSAKCAGYHRREGRCPHQPTTGRLPETVQVRIESLKEVSSECLRRVELRDKKQSC